MTSFTSDLESEVFLEDFANKAQTGEVALLALDLLILF
jgi:hypothetical protein